MIVLPTVHLSHPYGGKTADMRLKDIRYQTKEQRKYMKFFKKQEFSV